MKDFEQRKEEILRRGKQKIVQRKKTVRRVVMTCVPLMLCVCIAGGYLALGNFGQKSTSAPEDNMAMDSVARGDAIYDGAMVPESAPNVKPADGAPAVDPGMCLELRREGYLFSYTEPEVVDMFLEILAGEHIDPVDISGDGQKVDYGFNPDPEQLITGEQYLLKLMYPDGTEVYFTLRGQRLTRQDGRTYILNQEQASVLHKLLLLQWDGGALEGEPVMPTVTPEDSPQAERRPWYEDEVIELAKQQISWDYYAVTAEQDPETREWTVTFWSRDREDFQVVIIDQYGGILQVQEGTFWSATE